MPADDVYDPVAASRTPGRLLLLAIRFCTDYISSCALDQEIMHKMH